MLPIKIFGDSNHGLKRTLKYNSRPGAWYVGADRVMNRLRQIRLTATVVDGVHKAAQFKLYSVADRQLTMAFNVILSTRFHFTRLTNR